MNEADARGAALSALEIATGLVFGVGPVVQEETLPFATPRQALDAAVRPALERPPCLVSFSGGRDSSLILAVAVGAARREGLDLPIPATLRFPGAHETEEAEWQETVVASLGIQDWLRVEPRHELDVVGPQATRILRRHGLLWPFNAHFHVPLLRAARGASLLTGVGGDEIFGETYWDRVNAARARGLRLQPKDALRLGFGLAPRPFRRAFLRRHFPVRLPWLRPSAVRQLAEDWANEAAQERRRYGERPSWWLRTRAARLSLASLALLARESRVLLVHPFTDASVAHAISRTPSMAAADRSERMRIALGEDILAGIFARRSKASFDSVFWGPHARRFVAEWDGEGVDPEIVDRDVLRSVWQSEVPPPHSYTLLQSVWLAQATAGMSGAGSPQSRATTRHGDAGARRTAEPRASEATRDQSE